MVRVTVGQLQVPLPWPASGKPLSSLSLDSTRVPLHKEGSPCAAAVLLQDEEADPTLQRPWLMGDHGGVLSSWGDQSCQMPYVIQVLVRTLGT